MRLGPALAIFALWLFLSVALLASCSHVHAVTDQQRLAVTTYDAHLERAALRWMPEHDWRWLRAQCFQESRFRSTAISPAGARGLCQFMPGTWADAGRALGVRNVFDPRENAWAAGWYMRRQLNGWIWDRTDMQRLQLAQASYNAGRGNILAAQRICGSPRTWDEISPCLHRVTGHHSAETIGYVRQIQTWFELQCGTNTSAC